jgi:predicted SnoaL-like aldol condensation-catalyzing enzyme
MSERNKEIVRTFETEFKNKANVDIVDELMAPSFVHHAPIPGVAAGPEGMKQIGHFVFSLIDGIEVTLIHLIAEGDLVCSRISASGTMKESAQSVRWTENHFYRVVEGKIVEWWGEGGPPLG